jgi:large subunit ribosomal protein L28
MAKVCEICGKRPRAGRSIARRGLAKKKGGVGRRITGKSRRKFKPNLQRIKAVLKGKVKRLWVCTKCIKANKVQKSSL